MTQEDWSGTGEASDTSNAGSWSEPTAAAESDADEAWVASPHARRAGQFNGGTTVLPVRVPRGARVMVTIERAGGVDAPTSQPLVVAQA